MSFLRAGVSRRSFLGANLAMGGAREIANTHHLNRSATAAPAKRPPAPARAVIVLLQEGGMSQLESWDPKPSAPAEIRGSFSTIATTLPEFRIGEHMPRLSRQTSLFNVVRSVYMDNARRDHSPGLHWVLTGYDNQAAGVSLQKVNHLPSVGAVVAHQLGTTTPPVSPISLPFPTPNSSATVFATPARSIWGPRVTLSTRVSSPKRPRDVIALPKASRFQTMSLLLVCAAAGSCWRLSPADRVPLATGRRREF
ncbi:MAG: hypothetical protein CM1200mP2_31480 [Planctomycetaceae bacterium]|nr:MAG: hypothetical protein CM1200mP2_31480 [Planctomycetaceae bacterium]